MRVLVGGVNSPVRAFAGVGGTPRFIASASGARLIDVDGNEYVDYVGGYGPAILGHAHPAVVEAVVKAARDGFCFGAPTEAETALAERVVAAVDSIEKVRFVSSGTEAVMSAIRLARGFTERPTIVKFVGCYHGHADPLLVAAGSGATTLGVPSSPGVPEGATANTVLLAYNDIEAVAEFCEGAGDDVAAVIVEPIAGNMGVVPPQPGFLQGLRRLCDDWGILLIFDEVMTGFRVAYGGAQQLYGVRPDITTLGKVIGGGMPVGAFGARADIMGALSPEGPVYQAGTLSGNPLAMAAGLATLEQVAGSGFHDDLERTSAELEQGLRAAAAAAGLAERVCFNRVGSMQCGFFTPGPVTDYAGATSSDTEAFAAFFHAMLAAGVNLAPSQFEAAFVSAAHGKAEVEQTVAAAGEAFAAARNVIDSPAQSR